MATETDLQKAIPGYRAVEKEILAAGAVVPLYHDEEYFLGQPGVHNAELHPVFVYFYY
ncbi:hypothetical protein [Acididesulfobacillus acetoxydans]|uniref:hypothetical protein n=1 Tax=Acididesulfobacillus acetoxydans TaxID=1561005 RepID=UPI001F10C76D|nr:hypothetical protein [Acididesulfobacillus acetoxydans]